MINERLTQYFTFFMKDQEYLTMSCTQSVRVRFKETLSRLREQNLITIETFREFVFSAAPDFNCPDGWRELDEVWKGRKPNVRIMELIEEYEKSLNH